MTITARYPGRCKQCHGAINVGDRIEWNRGEGASHVECPEAIQAQADDATIHLACGEGYGGRPYTVGMTVRHPRTGDLVTIVTASQRYYRHDGMSFGVGDESGYLYMATARPATDDEAATILAAEAKARAASERKRHHSETMATIARKITGEHITSDRVPTDSIRYEGKTNQTWDGVGGHSLYYLGSDGAVWHTTSSYDEPYMTWRLDDPEAARMLRALIDDICE